MQTISDEKVSRTVRAIGGANAGTTQVSALFELDSPGDVSSVSFSIAYDQTRFTMAGASLGSGTPAGSSLSMDQSDVGAGRIGVSINAPTTFAAGTR